MQGSQWIEKNWNNLTKMAKHHHWKEWGELLSQYVIYIDKNWTKFSLIPDNDERLRFSQTWMKNSVQWANSDFNKSIRVNNLPEQYESEDVGEDHFIEVYCENDRDDIRDFMIDLSRRHSEYDVNRILLLRQVYLNLQIHDKVLYDLYFSQMLSMRQIAKKLDLPLSSVYNMIVKLKIELKEKCGIK